MNRLNLIEGLRGYLALWVLIGHVLMAAGYEASQCTRFMWLLRTNWFAVDMFVIVSGFVIFLLLDKKTESYREFICRRFFRLYPVFILLFFAAIPLSLIDAWNVQHNPCLTDFRAHSFSEGIQAAWLHWRWNILWHLPMLHGAVPDWYYHSQTDIAFLGPAWSISLEWQFYLLAPLLFLAATSERPLHRIGACVFCLYLFFGRRYLPLSLSTAYSAHGAFLPYHVEYFFVGAISYFIYKHARFNRGDIAFPVGLTLATILWYDNVAVGISLWVGFMALLLEHPESYSRRLVATLFANPLSQFLGRISYSIYLSHILVITAAEYFLLKYVGAWTQPRLFWTLLIITIVATVLISAMLYRFVEAPGIALGQKFALRLKKTPVLGPATLATERQV